MGKARILRNRRRLKDEVFKSKEATRLKETLAFKYTDETAKAHLSIFHDIMNGTPLELPGLEPGSSIARLHLTMTNSFTEEVEEHRTRTLPKHVAKAERALKFRPYGLPEDEEPEKPKGELKILDPSTLRDQHGQYPVWMRRRSVKHRARKNKTLKNKIKRLKAKGVEGPRLEKIKTKLMYRKGLKQKERSGEEYESKVPSYREIKEKYSSLTGKEFKRAMYGISG